MEEIESSPSSIPKKDITIEQNEVRGIYPINIKIEEINFDEWLSEFKIHKDAEERLLEWFANNTIEDFNELVSVTTIACLEEDNITDRYALMTNFVVELYSVRETVMKDVDELIDKLIHAVHRLDTECGLDSGLTENLTVEERASIIMQLDIDEKRFEDILREEYIKLKNETLQIFFLEFARCVHAFNGYQPPPRKATEIDEFVKDLKSPIFNFEHILSRLETFLIDLMDEESEERNIIIDDDDDEFVHIKFLDEENKEGIITCDFDELTKCVANTLAIVENE